MSEKELTVYMQYILLYHRLHALIQEFFSGGVQAGGQKTVLTTFFVVVILQSKLYFSKDPEGVQLFPGGGGGGFKCLFL